MQYVVDPRESVLKAPEPRSTDLSHSAETELLKTRHPRRDELTFVEHKVSVPFDPLLSSPMFTIKYIIIARLLCLVMHLTRASGWAEPLGYIYCGGAGGS